MTRDPLWLTVSLMLEGLSEVPGPASNPVILQWGRDIKAPGFVNDDTAWCAVYMNRLMMALQLPQAAEAGSWDLLRAAKFARWGQSLVTAVRGAILVFDRPGGAHVGLYLGESPTAYYVHGGNTTNRVAAAWIEKSRLVAVRWPDGVPLPEGAPTLMTQLGKVSTNEA